MSSFFSDTPIADDPTRDILLACGIVLVVGVLETVLRYVARRTLIEASRHVEENLKSDLVAHLGRLPMTWFDRSKRSSPTTSRSGPGN